MKITLSEISKPQSIIFAIAFVLGYIALDWASFAYAAGPLATTPWNPAPGIGLAILLIRGLSWSPILLVAVAGAEYLVRATDFSISQLLLVAAIVTLGQVAMAVALRNPLWAMDTRLLRVRDLIALTVSAAPLTLITAGGYVFLQSDATAVQELGLGRYLVRAWIGDLIGILVFTPLMLLAWHRRVELPRNSRPRNWLPHVFGVFATMTLAFWVVYGNRPSEQITSLYLMFLPLTWAALRFGLAGAVVTSLVIQLGIILLSVLGSQSDATVLQFQIRLLTLAATGLFLGVALDELRSAEQLLRERQFELDRTLRLAASAELSSALAHELNQPLSAIGVYTRACEIMVRNSNNDALRAVMGKIGVEVRRAGDVVHKLREFYRSGGSHIESVGIANLLQRSIEAISERAARHRVLISRNIESDLPAASIDRMQIETVLHNLLSNSIDALRDANSPKREVVVEAARGGKTMIQISVKDSGPGLGEASERIFRPLASGKTYGLGLGLSMSRSIVEAHGGALEWVPTPSGCVFRFTLPTVNVEN